MRILVKWPTRARAEKFSLSLERWIEYASDTNPVCFLISQDIDDTARFEVYGRWPLNVALDCGRLAHQPYNKRLVHVRFIEGACKTKIEAINYGVAGHGFDILVNGADDAWPQVQGWDSVIVEQMAKYFPALDGALNFWDGSPRQEYLCTMPVVGRRLYDFFGHIYHPDYISLYADQEFVDVCHKMGRMVVPEGWGKVSAGRWVREGQRCLIEHRHPIYEPAGVRGYDALMRRNEAPAMYAQDKATYERRKARNFDLPGTGAILS